MDCSDLSRTGCVSCEEGKVLFNGECLQECPYGFYLEDKNCLPCPFPCAACISSTYCTDCFAIAYKENNECKILEGCLDGSYKDENTCKPCSEACLTCTGPTQFECLECNYPEGYKRSSEESEECKLTVCEEGTYLEAAYCVPCNPYCKSCNRANYCVECKPGLIGIATEEGYMCEDCPVGFYFHEDHCKGNP